MFWTTIFLLQTSLSLACTCIYGGEFAENSARYRGVVRAKVIKYGRHHKEDIYKSIIVEVTDVVKGEFNHSKIKLIGDLGHHCREYAKAKKYQIGKEFLFVIGNNKKVQTLYGCGESSILIDGNTVKGYQLVGGSFKPYSMSLKTLTNKMKAEEIKYQTLREKRKKFENRYRPTIGEKILNTLREYFIWF